MVESPLAAGCDKPSSNHMQRKLEPSLVKMNESLQIWLDTQANKKLNQTKKEAPIERFHSEQGHLLNWKERPMFPINKWSPIRVNPQGLIEYDGKQYSVPIRVKGIDVEIKQTLDHYIEIYNDLECIASHPLIT